MDDPSHEPPVLEPTQTLDDKSEPLGKSDEEGVDETQKKRRRRRRKHRARKHSPEHLELIKKVKLNRKRETEWDSRFILESIPIRPDGLVQAKSNKKGLARHVPRISPSKDDPKVYRTFNGPETRGKAGPSKSFNIRVMTKKENPPAPLFASKSEHNEESISLKDSLLKELESAYEELKFSPCHFDCLKDIIKNSKSKTLKGFIQSQISHLKDLSSCSCSVVSAIEDRKKAIDKLAKEKDNPDIDTVIQEYRMSTLRVIESILKWKQDIEGAFSTHARMKTKLAYRHEGLNYVAQMGQHVRESSQEEEDVFLLGLGAEVEKEMLVKYRACETLILEQMLSEGQE